MSMKSLPKWCKAIGWILILLVLGYLALCIYYNYIQRDRIFEPTHTIQTNPGRLGMAFETVQFPSGSGEERGDLYAWWIPAAQPNAPTILCLHGNDKNISIPRDLDKAVLMNGMGYNLLMVDYRGYGKSTGGNPNERKLYEDAEAAWNYLHSQRGSLPQRTFIFGHSLGGAVAIELALHHPEAAGLITESTFTSMADMGKKEYGFLPVDMLLTEKFDSLGKIGKLKVPALFIHGTWDNLVPAQMSQRLYENAPQPKYLKLIEGGEHGNSSGVAWPEYRDALGEFIRRYAR